MSDYWLHRHGALPTGRDNNNTYGSKDIDNMWLHRHNTYEFGDLAGGDEDEDDGYPVYPYEVYDSQNHEGTYDADTHIATINNIDYLITSKTNTCKVTSTNTVPYDNTVVLDWIRINDVQYDVISICNNAFYGANAITSLTIGNNITAIPDYCCYNCSKLNSITIPDSVTSIGNYAFYQCSSLESVVIPDSVTSIGSHTFYGDTSLKTATISNSITGTMPNAMFSGCTALTTTAIPSGITRTSGSTFNGCSKLTSMVIPDNVVSLAGFDFQNCSSMTYVVIPASLTSIGNYTFKGCGSLNIRYKGSSSQWSAITKGTDWNSGSTISYTYNYSG